MSSVADEAAILEADAADTTTTTTTIGEGGADADATASPTAEAASKLVGEPLTGATTISTVAESRIPSTASSDLPASKSLEEASAGAGGGGGGSRTVVLADAGEFVKPDRDLRHYRAIRLPNNLECLLVSDGSRPGEISVEAASVHVQAGHFDDAIPGLSHFHEHMLFLGTSKYPGEDDYETYLSQFGGFSNAYTDMEDTNYYFHMTTAAPHDPSTTTEALRGALDRLAQFFISPLFSPDAVERELSAIDSEYRNGKTSDVWRNYQLLKASCNSGHPFANFGCGNYETLTQYGTERLLDELHKFWSTFYRTYNLRLAVVGHGSLDALQRTVEDTFGSLPYSTGEPRRVKSNPNPKALFRREHAVYGGAPAFGKPELGLMRHVVPVAEMRTVKIYFAVPPLEDPLLSKSKPYRTLSHVLGHEAPGSLHALLNEQPGGAWVSSLSSGIGIDTSDFSLFSVTVGLTPLGMAHQSEVLGLIFSWIALIRQQAMKTTEDIGDANDREGVARANGDPVRSRLAAYHDELRQISSTNFRFRENGDPTEFCSTASELLFDSETPLSRLLLGGSDVSEYDHDVMLAFLDRLRPDNCMITVINSDLKANVSNNASEWLTEPLYGAQYRVEPISREQKEAWSNDALLQTLDPRLKLPALNEYIPTDFSLRADDNARGYSHDAVTSSTADPTEPPTLFVHRPNLRMWHKMDQYWRVPKTFIRLAILSPKSYQTPRSMTLTRIFQRVLNDDLNSYVYDASIAGCSYRVSCTPYGYRISVRGYSEKLPFLLDTLTTRILSLIQEMKDGSSPTLRDKFEKAKESLLRETKNYRLDPPHEVASYNSRLLIEENVWYLDNYVDELEGPEADRHPLTMEECAQVAEECFMGRVKCEALCMGNIDQAGVEQVVSVIDRHFLGPTSRPLSEVETPRFRSLKLPTRGEAQRIFGPAVADRTLPLVYQDVALSDSEENNAVEVIIQAGCELDLGYEGMAILDLITHMAYTSAFTQLRTKEQLGYIVSAFARKTAGSTWGMSIVIQSSKALPSVLEERCEAWLEAFRRELEDMPAEEMAQEASAVVAQLLEKETKLSQEVSRVWGEILNTEGFSDRMRNPSFDRLDRLAQELTVTKGSRLKTDEQLKSRVLAFFDEHFSVKSANRRAMTARVYNQKSRMYYDASVGEPGVLSSYSDMRHFKQFLSSWPVAPYWRVVDENASALQR
jgi:insulysin